MAAVITLVHGGGGGAVADAVMLALARDPQPQPPPGDLSSRGPHQHLMQPCQGCRPHRAGGSEQPKPPGQLTIHPDSSGIPPSPGSADTSMVLPRSPARCRRRRKPEESARPHTMAAPASRPGTPPTTSLVRLPALYGTNDA